MSKQAPDEDCLNCAGTEWVCENHMDRPWGVPQECVSDRADACDCGVSVPCPVCRAPLVVGRDAVNEMRAAFDSDDVPRKNRALRWAHDVIMELGCSVEACQHGLEPFARIAAVADALPPDHAQPDDQPLKEACPGGWPDLGDARRALRLLGGVSGRVLGKVEAKP